MVSPSWNVLTPSSIAAGRVGMLEAREPSDAAVPLVLLGDPQPARGARLQEALAPVLGVIYESQLEALERRCQQHPPAVLALPLHWPQLAAAEATPETPAASAPVLRLLRTYGHRLAIVVYTDTSRLPIGAYCQPLAAGARQILNEGAPTFADDLRQTLGRLVQDHHAQLEEQEQLGGLFAAHGLLGRSLALREVFRRVIKASHFSDLPVLLIGETGTGKQRLAEAIHALDARRQHKPLLTVNCSALSKTLAQSQLFGHTKGAFSDAVDDRRGLFRTAEGGTLLLDEVGDLDAELQPKLLRVLQERRLLPVGEDYEYPIDVRIIAATNRPLDELVAAGKFRKDLYQRLNVFRIRVPPLRERPEDIEVQARHFLALHQEDRPEPILDFGPRVLEALRRLPWEGNTRQLENLVRELIAHKDSGPVLQMEDLPRWVLEHLAGPMPARPEPDLLQEMAERACRDKLSWNAAVEEYERWLLQTVLQQHGGNRTRTAAELGVTPRSIFNKLKKYQLDQS